MSQAAISAHIIILSAISDLQGDITGSGILEDTKTAANASDSIIHNQSQTENMEAVDQKVIEIGDMFTNGFTASQLASETANLNTLIAVCP